MDEHHKQTDRPTDRPTDRAPQEIVCYSHRREQNNDIVMYELYHDNIIQYSLIEHQILVLTRICHAMAHIVYPIVRCSLIVGWRSVQAHALCDQAVPTLTCAKKLNVLCDESGKL